MSLAKKITEFILQNCLSVGTLQEWQQVTKLDLDKDYTKIVNGIRERVLELIQKRIDPDDNWLTFAALPDNGEYPDDFVELVLGLAAAAYERGYVDGFKDRDELLHVEKYREALNEKERMTKKD